MDCWYPAYWSQTWYGNTFLVNRPEQIARTRDGDWNNVHDSGCHFTCLAMILGIDPARLAAELRARGDFFAADPACPAIYSDGGRGGFVWDCNAPNRARPLVTLEDIWHPLLGRRVSIALRFVDAVSTLLPDEGRGLVEVIRDRRNHIICGPRAHSHLVAGKLDGDYFIWDPDGSSTRVEDSLAGRFPLRSVFDAYPGQAIEFWEYEVEIAG